MAKATAPSAEPVPVEQPPVQTVEESSSERFPLTGRVEATPAASGVQRDVQEKPADIPDEEFRGDEGEDDDPSSQQEDEQPRDEHGRFTKGQTLRDRLSAEARERVAAQQRADRLEMLLAQQQELLAKQLGGENQAGSSRDPSAPPNPDDYPAGRFDPDYLEAVTNHRVNQALESRILAEQHRQTQARLIGAEQQFAAAHDDYLDAKQNLMADPMIANHPGIGGAIIASAHPAELIYVLGHNPQVASSIARMDPVSAAMAIGRIEAIIEASMQQPASAGARQAPAARQAPPPIKPVGTSSPPANMDISQARTYAEFVAIREAQEKHRAGK